MHFHAVHDAVMTNSRFERFYALAESTTFAAALATRYRLCYADATGFGGKG
jgi:hypothetical protein